ncbi:hypothetical protein ACFOWB_02375 [Chenggangzhangella methanolivorans]
MLRAVPYYLRFKSKDLITITPLSAAFSLSVDIASVIGGICLYSAMFFLILAVFSTILRYRSGGSGYVKLQCFSCCCVALLLFVFALQKLTGDEENGIVARLLPQVKEIQVELIGVKQGVAELLAVNKSVQADVNEISTNTGLIAEISRENKKEIQLQSQTIKQSILTSNIIQESTDRIDARIRDFNAEMRKHIAKTPPRVSSPSLSLSKQSYVPKIAEFIRYNYSTKNRKAIDILEKYNGKFVTIGYLIEDISISDKRAWNIFEYCTDGPAEEKEAEKRQNVIEEIVLEWERANGKEMTYEQRVEISDRINGDSEDLVWKYEFPIPVPTDENDDTPGCQYHATMYFNGGKVLSGTGGGTGVWRLQIDTTFQVKRSNIGTAVFYNLVEASP